MFANQPFQLEPLLRHASSDAATQSREIVICRCFGDPASRFNSLILIVLFIVMTLCYETAPTLNRNRLSRSRALCMNPNIEEDSFPQSKRGIVHPCLKEGGCWRASAVPLACPGGWKPAPPPWPRLHRGRARPGWLATGWRRTAPRRWTRRQTPVRPVAGADRRAGPCHGATRWWVAAAPIRWRASCRVTHP